jgi:hypothetical protein
MKKISYGVRFFLLASFFVFVVTVNYASSASNQEEIMGKWEFMGSFTGGLNKGDTIEFLKNGKFLRTTKGDIDPPGTYEFLDDNRLQISSFYGMSEVKISNGTLSLKQLDKINKGQILEFKQIK